MTTDIKCDFTGDSIPSWITTALKNLVIKKMTKKIGAKKHITVDVSVYNDIEVCFFAKRYNFISHIKLVKKHTSVGIIEF